MSTIFNKVDEKSETTEGGIETKSALLEIPLWVEQGFALLDSADSPLFVFKIKSNKNRKVYFGGSLLFI
ncbi:hypothetical protein D3C87_819710 [compost metagenome]